MSRIIMKWGLLSGAIVGAWVAVMPLLLDAGYDLSGGEVIGYTTMFLAFLMVFFGVRSYRDSVRGGEIKFGEAFKVGIMITLVACAIYVITWEIVYYNFIPDFADRYSALVLEKMRTKGATTAAIEAERQKMAEFKEMYKNPLINVGFTFIEIFPVGLVMTLISAGILKRTRAATPLPA